MLCHLSVLGVLHPHLDGAAGNKVEIGPGHSSPGLGLVALGEGALGMWSAIVQIPKL
jgi:hypothetical protein